MFWERVLRVTRNFDQNFCPVKGTYYANERTYMEKIPCRKILKVPDRHQGLRTLLKTLVRVWGEGDFIASIIMFFLSRCKRQNHHPFKTSMYSRKQYQTIIWTCCNFFRSNNKLEMKSERKKKGRKIASSKNSTAQFWTKMQVAADFCFFLVPEFFFFFFVKFKTSSFFVSKKAPKDFASRFFIQAKINSKKMIWV